MAWDQLPRTPHLEVHRRDLFQNGEVRAPILVLAPVQKLLESLHWQVSKLEIAPALGLPGALLPRSAR